MSDFPSIDDLVPDEQASVEVGPDSSARDRFDKKLGQIQTKQKEINVMKQAAQSGYPHIDLNGFPVSQQALTQLPQADAERLQAVCFFATTEQVRVGAIDPTNAEVLALLESLQDRNHAEGALYQISQRSFDHVIDLYARLPVVKLVTKDISIREEDLAKVEASITDFESLGKLLERATASDLMIYLLGAALKLNVSDVHIEAEEHGIVARFRLDGILHEATQIDKELYAKFVSRVKLVASIKINITDKPQDGRFTIKLATGDVDVRVSTMPTVYGESIVMRLLKQSRSGLSLDNIGLTGDAYVRLSHEITRPNGMITTTGPTGSGKTTTLYAVMTILNKPGVKIITLEDPVEYRMQGINQSQIDRSRDYTFAKGLRSILRQDPDIAMVGEIRDLETAEIAIQAALTGHLILSTIHTNSAAGAIPRFLSMGVKPFLLAPALDSVIGQRLLRRICTECIVEDTLTDEQKRRVEEVISSMPETIRAGIETKNNVFYRGRGCEVCNGIGYKGRVGIYEILIMDGELEQMVLSGRVSEYEIEKHAVSRGMVTMVQDGILKAIDKITSVEEVFRVIE
jgi:type IV pilus assembly protein PilB